MRLQALFHFYHTDVEIRLRRWNPRFSHFKEMKISLFYSFIFFYIIRYRLFLSEGCGIMKKYLAAIVIAIVLLAGGGFFAYVHFLSGGPWQGTWWGVQDAGVNWSGDHIRNLETLTFTKNDDKTITVEHKVQQGSKEVNGSLAGTGTVDGGRLVITPDKGGREIALSYNTMSKTIETPLTNADKTAVTLQALTQDNNDEMEQIRSEIVQISQKPENKIDTTLSSSKS